MLASRERHRSREQIGLRRGPGLAGWHAGELAGQAPAVLRLKNLADRQVVDDHDRGQRPVTGRDGVPHRVGGHVVPLVPPGRALMQGDHPVRMLVPQSQPEHFGEQRVVAVPPRADRLDQRVRVRQGGQDACGLVVAGQFGGRLGADMLQDARAQQDLADLRWLDVEHLVNQVAGQGAVLGHQLLDEQVRVGMGDQRYRGQAETGGPALGSPVQALQRVLPQRPAVLLQQQAGLIEAEREVAGAYLGQLSGQPVPVQGQQRIHPRGDHQPQRGPYVPEDELEPFQHGRIGQQVKVVKDQRDRRVLGGQRGRQPEQESLISRPSARNGP